MPRGVYKRTVEMRANMRAARKHPKIHVFVTRTCACGRCGRQFRCELTVKHPQRFIRGHGTKGKHNPKLSAALKGKKRPKISAANKKRYEDPVEHEKSSAVQNRSEVCAAKSAASKKHYEDPAACERQRINATGNPKMMGKKNPAFNDWSSFKPYDQEFSLSFKESVRADGNRTCQLCGKTEAQEFEEFGQVLSVHHCLYGKITKEDIFVALCCSCNKKVDKKSEKDYWTKFFVARLILAA